MVLALSASTVLAAPGDTLYLDDFERDTGIAPWTTSDATLTGINTDTSETGTRSLYVNGGAVATTSEVIDTSAVPIRLDMWIRRGSDAFSEDPDTEAEGLYVEYLDDTATWIEIDYYPGNGTAGEIINLSEVLPSRASHSGFQVRVRMTNGSGTPWDFWHIDNVEIIEESAFAPTPPPFSIDDCEYFDDSLVNWTVTATTGEAGTNNDTFNAASSDPNASTPAMYLSEGAVTVTSDLINTNYGGFSSISMWVQRGSDAFSENPENGENLTVEYFDSSLGWVTLETFPGGGTQGEQFNRVYGVPTTAQHENFQLRFSQNTGSGNNFDYWHVDDVCLESIPFPRLGIQKTSSTQWDPINLYSQPKAIPGSIVIYEITLSNTGDDSPDPSAVTIEDMFDTGFDIYLGDYATNDTVPYTAGQPVDFEDGPVYGDASSNLSLNFVSLGDGGDDIEFLNNLGNVITPSPDTSGYDSNVRGIRVTPSGTMNFDASGATTPSFKIYYRGTIN